MGSPADMIATKFPHYRDPVLSAIGEEWRAIRGSPRDGASSLDFAYVIDPVDGLAPTGGLGWVSELGEARTDIGKKYHLNNGEAFLRSGIIE